jgi:hypothetical protein
VNLKVILTVIGGILVGIGVIKMSVMATTPREAPLFLSILIVGGICALVAQKLPWK